MDRGDPLPEDEWRTDGVSNSQVADLVPEIGLEPVAVDEPAVTDVVSILDEMLVNGGAVLAVLRITGRPALAYRAASHVRAAPAFYEHLFTSAAFAEAAPEMDVGDELLIDLVDPQHGESTIEPRSPFEVDGLIARRLDWGGAYYDFERGGPQHRGAPETYGTPADAKRLAEEFVEAAFDYRFGDLDAYRSGERWCEWFHPIGIWNETLVVIDKRYRLVWTLCLTDVD